MTNLLSRISLPLLILCTACGGGGGGSGGGTSGGSSPSPVNRAVSFPANMSFVPWASGSLEFQVNPPLAAGETIGCQIDTLTTAPCTATTGGGRANYGPITTGTHTLNVTIVSSGVQRLYALPFEITAPDIVVYGGTPSGVVAALAASRMGRKVILIEPSAWLGGMMSGGLAKTDVGRAGGAYIGGIAREVFDRIRAREIESGGCPSTSLCPEYFDFEPKIAMEIFDTMLGESKNILIQRGLGITGVVKVGTKIVEVETPLGRIAGKVFIDASYEGDLSAKAGVSMTQEREASLPVGPSDQLEDDAGVGSFTLPYGLEIDPYVVPGDPASGLIAFVQAKKTHNPGAGTSDRLVMAYNYRLCVTDDPVNRVAFIRPAGYDPALFEGSARLAVAMAASGRKAPDELYFNPVRTVRSASANYFKYDVNGGSVFSTDMTAPDLNQAFPEGSAAARAQIAQRYRSYTEGLLYFWQTDPRFGALNAKVARFGLCKDEFTDNGNWPYRLYTRETRRMVSNYVMNENDILRNGRRAPVTDSVGMGAYNMDSHVRQIIVIKRAINGAPARDLVASEGFRNVRQTNDTPYPISYQSLVPRSSEVINLLNPVTLSSTSMAYSALRMEPTFMILGQGAGTAAALATEGNTSIQDVNIQLLQLRLRNGGQVIN